tara:strand:+ start:1827 stop:2021 length:195 start_codon:yes stop_codon:yes gene_type:complete
MQRADCVIAMTAAMAYIKNRAVLILRLDIVTILRTNQMEIAWAEFTPPTSSAGEVMNLAWQPCF